MARKNIYDIIQTKALNADLDYSRLYKLVHQEHYLSTADWAYTIMDVARDYFLYFDSGLRNRAISLEEFESRYPWKFTVRRKDLSIEQLIDYCEFLYNICTQVRKLDLSDGETDIEMLEIIEESIENCAADYGYTRIEKSGIHIFVEANSSAVAVSEICPDTLAYSVLEYNHRCLKGKLMEKQLILKQMADDIEPLRKELSGLNKSLSDMLFQLMNKFVRHSKEKTPYIQMLSDDQLEGIYDDIYQMWLFAKMELDHVERKKRAKEILNIING